ncbi:MAG: carboxypeptidase-like regulatory domain-containing protein [Bacteroidia bacterium]
MFKRIGLALFLAMSFSVSLHGQEVFGIVRDANSRLPIANAQVITANRTVLTDTKGRFTLINMRIGTAVAVRIMGYQTVELKINHLKDSILVYLRQGALQLDQVEVRTKRNYKLDSLALRKEYANAFVYKGPNVLDMFIEKDINYDSPFGFSNPRSTASIASLNVLQILNLFGKKQTQTTRLSRTLIRDEELNYIDYAFSKEKVSSITGLNGEALLKFMNLYRPNIMSLKRMTGYELTLYIKKSYEEFSKIK